MRRLFFFCVLTSLGGNALQSDIINGKKTKVKSMLYMASVQNKDGHICGGFLISKDFVVTAAHCDERKPTSVVLGTHNLNKVNDETMRFSVKTCKHPSYKDVASGNDIMLLKLSRKVPLGKKARIKPIQLPSPNMKLKEKTECRIAGWGFTSTGGRVVDDLRDVEVPIINLDKCQERWSNHLPANVTCAGGYGTKNGMCQGDSGGPLVYKDKIAVGVASFNNHNTCDYPELPNVYTDVTKYLPWIKEILKKKNC